MYLNKGHKGIKRPLGRNVRHGQVAQAATVARSKDTMLFAFKRIHLRRRKPVHPQSDRDRDRTGDFLRDRQAL